MNILADIGGTYARFCLNENGTLKGLQKYPAADFETFDAALEKFCSDSGIQNKGQISIATAAYEDQGLWKFVNQNQWEISPENLKKKGWSIPVILNDFEAATWSLLALEKEEKRILRQAEGASDTLCLLGPGTGLGLGFLCGKENPYVQKTHGGHMPAVAVTEEQWLVMQTIHRLNRGKIVTVFEHLVSGPGLYNIYAARCMMAGKLRAVNDTEKLVAHRDDPEVKAALRLFHEFLGLFAAGAVITAHAYGGVFLTGGVLDRLEEHGAFDIEHFQKFFDLDVAASVKRDLRATPITRIATPYPALKGLLVFEQRKRNAV